MNQPEFSFDESKSVGKEKLKLTAEQEARFWGRVNKNGPLPDQASPHYVGLDQCWVWTASVTDRGYGRFFDGSKTVRSHRVSYGLCVGIVPRNQDCLHRCDNPGCVNPSHLWIGTQADNNIDCIAKDRMPDTRGARASNAQLTEGQVKEIKHSPEMGIVMAAKFGVSKATISRIRNGVCWSNIE